MYFTVSGNKEYFLSFTDIPANINIRRTAATCIKWHFTSGEQIITSLKRLFPLQFLDNEVFGTLERTRGVLQSFGAVHTVVERERCILAILIVDLYLLTHTVTV